MKIHCRKHLAVNILNMKPIYNQGWGQVQLTVLKYTKYPKYIPSTSTGQVLIFLKST